VLAFFLHLENGDGYAATSAVLAITSSGWCLGGDGCCKETATVGFLVACSEIESNAASQFTGHASLLQLEASKAVGCRCLPHLS
jgi:hypothetical protein